MSRLFLGASKIETYQQCPRKYRLQYIDQIKAPKPTALIVGTAVHAGVESLHHGQPVEAAIENATARANASTSKVYDNQMTPAQINTQISKLVRTYDRYAEKLKYDGIEEEFEIPGANVVLTGTIDATADGHKTVIELKTAKTPWPQQRADFSTQPTVYAFKSHFVHKILEPIRIIYRILVKPTVRQPVDKDLKNPDGKPLTDQTRKWNDLVKSFADFTQGKALDSAVGLSDEFTKLTQKTAQDTINAGIAKVNEVDAGRLQQIETTRSKDHFGHLVTIINGVAVGIKAGSFPRHITPLCGYCQFKQVCLGPGYGQPPSENGGDI